MRIQMKERLEKIPNGPQVWFISSFFLNLLIQTLIYKILRQLKIAITSVNITIKLEKFYINLFCKKYGTLSSLKVKTDNQECMKHQILSMI